METLFTKKKYLKILKKIEGSVYYFSDLAKELFEAGDFEALHRIVVGNQGWLRAQGIIKEQLSGTGESWHSNGQLSSRGTYVDGKAHGAWEYFNDNGQLWTRGAYEDGERHGVWEYFYDGHPWMRGTFEHGLHHGVWEWFYKNGKLFERRTYEHGRLIKTETFN